MKNRYLETPVRHTSGVFNKKLPGDLLFLVLAVMMAFSCTPQSCQEETGVVAGVSFYRSGTGRTEAPDSVTLYGYGKEGSYIYRKATGRTVIFLPFDASADSCGFIISLNGIRDTLKFIYSTYPSLLSRECGYVYFHDISESRFTGNVIDTVIFMNKRVTNRNEENLRIFY